MAIEQIPRQRGRLIRDLDPVALTALLYLQEAVLRERYEECAETVAIARRFGAGEEEIQGVLEYPRRSIRAQQAARFLGFN